MTPRGLMCGEYLVVLAVLKDIKATKISYVKEFDTHCVVLQGTNEKGWNLQVPLLWTEKELKGKSPRDISERFKILMEVGFSALNKLDKDTKRGVA